MSIFPSRVWREFPQRYRLEAGKCTGCGKTFFPPRVICDACKGREFETVRLPEEGTLETFTVIRVAPAEFDRQAPYAVGLLDMGDGVRVMCQVVDADLEDLEIGAKLRLEFRKIQEDGPSGVIAYGYKAVPV